MKPFGYYLSDFLRIYLSILLLLLFVGNVGLGCKASNALQPEYLLYWSTECKGSCLELEIGRSQELLGT